MSLTVHQDIKDKLDFFIKSDKIPNIIFHGQSGSGKRILVSNFVSKIYNDNKVGSFKCIHESKFNECKFATFRLDNKISLLLNIQNIAQFCYTIESSNINGEKLPDSQINFNDFSKKFDEIKF